VVWLATPGSLADLLNPLADARQLTIALSDVEGGSVFGAAQSGALPVMPDATHLPFIVRAAPAPDFASAWRDSDRLRRSLLVAGLVGAFALMVAAALALYRVTMRRLRLARQESDFVSAVSHEFRTPLTSMRHLTDLLRSGSIADSERRSQYYGLLGRETERLHRMVESLLSLGRIDAGAYVWRLESSDAGDLARAAVDEFRNEPQAVGREIVCEVESPLRPIHVDREALNRALWNLLENASKYSKPGTPIRVSVRRSADAVTVDVADAGIGIPAAERSLIFQKFVRGAEAKRAGIRGVGVGLALVQRIVEAHGGSVRLERELGRGSTFTLVFPCPES
jgi:signal transduction histidine kinase